MIKWKIPLYKILVEKEDITTVSKVINRGMDWAVGPEIENFEKKLSNYVQSNYCLSFNSGTSALHAALLALGIQKGNEVISPAFTFIATSNSALMVNAIPKFVDIEEETYGLDPIKLENQITKKTKVIIPVHYAGLPCKIDQICKIAKQAKIPVIEDAAESIGATINKRVTGTFGDLSILSFAGNKVITTGEGGAIVTNSRKLYEKLKLIRSHGRIDKQNYFSSTMTPNYVTLGYNWRMSSMTAALGSSQLSRIEKLISLRRKNANYYFTHLNNLEDIKLPIEPEGYRHVYQLYSIRLPNKTMRNRLMIFLSKKGIMTKIFFSPIHLTKFYKGGIYPGTENLEVTERVADQILSIPMFPGLKKEELGYICNSISEFIEKK
ncbi:MAG TPA: DegT/DnrJ/EryC1/StrS family aminotransferase [Candidatus Nitrosotalea sp.]|nr:DegT/DnrJ/EryC1/StrS family aminotransferase [Candidatus Nitrosotalea sp.]